jgi:disulfide oxidoreductase YuzD
MYTLRTITKNCDTNKIIGEWYKVVRKKFNKENFEKYYKDCFNKEKDEMSKKIYAFLQTDDFIVPLYSDEFYYIVSEGGKTFENLSVK